MTYRSYNAIFLGILMAVALPWILTAIWLQPLSGDLTRLGGYAENDFGWNGVQDVFVPPRAHRAEPGERYDILVIGDSFSRRDENQQTPTGGFWVDHLAAMSGLRVGVLDLNVTDIGGFLAGAWFRDHPPGVLIYQAAERTLQSRLGAGDPFCGDAAAPKPLSGARNLLSLPDRMVAAAQSVPMASARNLSWTNWDTRFGQALDLLEKAVPRLALGINRTRVAAFDLMRHDLFSSRRADTLLVYEDELARGDWPEVVWQRIACGLSDLQRRVEAPGGTRFLAVIAPDKSTVYAEFAPALTRLRGAFADPGIASAPHWVRLDLPLRAAVATGARDIYLPNDTHWGSGGAKIAARAVMQELGARR